MTTLQDILESWENGQYKQFADQIKSYGHVKFADDIHGNEEVDAEQCYDMLRYIVVYIFDGVQP